MMDIRNRILKITALCAAIGGAFSCVKVDNELGFCVVPDSERAVTRTLSVPIRDIWMASIDSVSGYTTQRIVLGVTRDEFGITRHGTALALVPVTDTLKWGANIRIKGMHLSATLDSSFCVNEKDRNLITGLKVYALEQPLDSIRYGCDDRLKLSHYAGKPTITVGEPTTTGRDSLSFDFTADFARSYLPEEVLKGSAMNEVIDSIYKYTRKHCGIFVCPEDPAEDGGRIDFYGLRLVYNSETYIVTGCFAELKFTADYPDKTGKLVQKDTSFLFSFGASSFRTDCYYSAFNTCENTSLDGGSVRKKVSNEIKIEGGLGQKPMIEAGHLRAIVREQIGDTLAAYGFDELYGDNFIDSAFFYKEVVINRATIVLPYTMPADYLKMNAYPKYLNPSMRLRNGGNVFFGGLSDATVPSENQGVIDRSNCCYRPDISHHLQEILSTPADSVARLERENLWLLALADETIVTPKSNEAIYNEQMAYLNYYNSMLSGGYYGYGNSVGYDNYYSYYAMQALMNSSTSTSTTTVTQLIDVDRYYNATLHGPESGDRVPMLEIAYSFRQDNH